MRTIAGCTLDDDEDGWAWVISTGRRVDSWAPTSK